MLLLSQESQARANTQASAQICALCGTTTRLQESHLIPRWIHRKLKLNGRSLCLDFGKDIAHLRQSDFKKKLLCLSCEKVIKFYDDRLKFFYASIKNHQVHSLFLSAPNNSTGMLCTGHYNPMRNFELISLHLAQHTLNKFISWGHLSMAFLSVLWRFYAAYNEDEGANHRLESLREPLLNHGTPPASTTVTVLTNAQVIESVRPPMHPVKKASDCFNFLLPSMSVFVHFTPALPVSLFSWSMMADKDYFLMGLPGRIDPKVRSFLARNKRAQS